MGCGLALPMWVLFTEYKCNGFKAINLDLRAVYILSDLQFCTH